MLLFENQAQKLDVKVGDALTISAPTTRGTNNTMDVRVVAIAHRPGAAQHLQRLHPGRRPARLYQLNQDSTGAHAAS